MKQYAVGVVEKCHGLDGFLRVRSLSGEYGHFQGFKLVTARKDGQELKLELEAIRVSEQFALVKFRGMDSRERAQALAGWELWVEEKDACPLGADEFRIAELCKCRLQCGGKDLGAVTGVLDTAASPLLEVKLLDGSVRMVPFVKEHVESVDAAGGVIVLRSEWILE
jgi:16S rRNA processing protein RimM